MTESEGEIFGQVRYPAHDTVILQIELSPEDSKDPLQIWDWRIGERVKVVGNERT